MLSVLRPILLFNMTDKSNKAHNLLTEAKIIVIWGRARGHEGRTGRIPSLSVYLFRPVQLFLNENQSDVRPSHPQQCSRSGILWTALYSDFELCCAGVVSPISLSISKREVRAGRMKKTQVQDSGQFAPCILYASNDNHRVVNPEVINFSVKWWMWTKESLARVDDACLL